MQTTSHMAHQPCRDGVTRAECGLCEAMLLSPGLRSAQDGSRPGVWGVGDHYGVYGTGYKLYADQVDNTPRVSLDAELGLAPDDPNAKGAIAAVGASLNVAGVLGVADLVNDLSKASPGSHFVEAATLVQEIAAHPAGVIEISGSDAGVIGINVSGTGVVASISQQLWPNYPLVPAIQYRTLACSVGARPGAVVYSVLHNR